MNAVPDWRTFPELRGRLRTKPPNDCGLYFLFADGEIVYIGAADFPGVRVEIHRSHKWKRFDSAMYFATEPHLVSEQERFFIRTFCPRHNVCHNPNYDPAYPSW